MPLYSNLLALEDEHGIAIGVVHLPALGETVWAGRGLGCWTERGPARVSTTATLDGAYVMSSSFSHWRPEHVQALTDAGAVLRTWGDGYGYAMVACGGIEVMIDPEVSLWDVAPMPVIIGEAGGRFSSLDGTEPLLEPGLQPSFVASNGLVHDDVIRALNATGA